MQVSHAHRFEAVRTGLTVIDTLRRLYPEQFRWRRGSDGYYIDSLLGSDEPRRRLSSGDPLSAILSDMKGDVERFLEKRRSYLLYR